MNRAGATKNFINILQLEQQLLCCLQMILLKTELFSTAF
jgi:hypothetical protein